VSTGGTQTTVGTGFTTSGVVDIASWQGTQIMLSDSVAQKVFSWNGSALTTVFTAQPVNYIGVFGGRLWMAINSTIVWTNANTNNSLTGDSGSFIITDSQCANPILGLVDTPLGLMVFGSNWIKTITNLITQGSPAVLTFQQVTLESIQAPINKWSVIVLDKVYFGNTAGFWRIDGSMPTQISAPNLNGFFSNLDTSSVSSFSGAYGVINSTPCVFWQVRYLGDTQVSASYTIIGYTLSSTLWFRFVQGTITWITGIVSSAITQNAPTMWGTDGTNIFKLFSNTTTVINSNYNSKLWDMGSALDIDNILSVAVVLICTGATTITVNQLNEQNRVQFSPPSQSFNPSLGQLQNNSAVLGNGVNNSNVQGQFQGIVQAAYFLAQFDGVGRVRCFALNIVVNGAGTSLVSIVVSYRKTKAGKGS